MLPEEINIIWGKNTRFFWLLPIIISASMMLVLNARHISLAPLHRPFNGSRFQRHMMRVECQS